MKGQRVFKAYRSSRKEQEVTLRRCVDHSSGLREEPRIWTRLSRSGGGTPVSVLCPFPMACPGLESVIVPVVAQRDICSWNKACPTFEGNTKPCLGGDRPFPDILLYALKLSLELVYPRERYARHLPGRAFPGLGKDTRRLQRCRGLCRHLVTIIGHAPECVRAS